MPKIQPIRVLLRAGNERKRRKKEENSKRKKKKYYSLNIFLNIVKKILELLEL